VLDEKIHEEILRSCGIPGQRISQLNRVGQIVGFTFARLCLTTRNASRLFVIFIS